LFKNEVHNQRLRKLLELTLDRLPNEAAKILLEGLTVTDIKECLEEPCQYAKFSTGSNTITLSIDALSTCNDLAATGVIIHELAHPFQLRTDSESWNALDDDKVDQIACGWGFVREIKAMRESNPL